MQEFTKSYAINRIVELIDENAKLKKDLVESEDKITGQWLRIQADTEYIQRLEQQLLDKDRTLFAIDELEKVRKIVNEDEDIYAYGDFIDYKELSIKIEQRIQELKEDING